MIGLGLAALVPGAAARATPVLDFTGGSSFALDRSGVAGWAFDVATPIAVVGLGLFDSDPVGLAFTKEVGLWTSDGTLLASVTVTNENSTPVPSTSDRGGWRFTSIPVLELPTGRYVIGATFTRLPGDNFLAGAVASTIPEIRFVGPRTALSTTLAMPTAVSSPVAGHFGPNLQLIPEPASLFLLAGGLAGAAAVGSKRRRASRPRRHDRREEPSSPS